MGEKGYGRARGAGTIINAIATYKGSAFAIDLWTEATVELGEDLRGIEAEAVVEGETNIDVRLIKRCVEIVLERFGFPLRAFVRTRSEIPVASGLKSSSAAANAVVLATIDAIGEKEKIDALEAIRMGVKASLDVGVSITGAFDDASASLLGGIVITDNKRNEIIKRVEKEASVIILIPEEKAFTAHTDVKRSRLIAPWVDMAYRLALEGRFEEAMTLNGFLYCAALGFDVSPMLKALECGVKGVNLSGTGPSFVALPEKGKEDELYNAWGEFFGGRVIKTRISNENLT
ncbi:MAG: shikimate kinase [Candidatus Methanospirareceae archaeon]